MHIPGGLGRADVIKGRQESILFFFSSGAQLCGQIPQSTNLQEEKALRYAYNVQLLIDTSCFPTFPSKPDAIAAEIQPPSQHTAPRAGDPVGN